LWRNRGGIPEEGDDCDDCDDCDGGDAAKYPEIVLKYLERVL
jgi:hypothetical protein